MRGNVNVHLQISVLAHDVDAIRFIIDESPAIMPPFNHWKWLGKNVARYVARLSGPDVHLGDVIGWKPRRNYKQQHFTSLFILLNTNNTTAT